MSEWEGVTTDETRLKVIALDLTGKMSNVSAPEFAECLNRLSNLREVSYGYEKDKKVLCVPCAESRVTPHSTTYISF